MLIPRLVMSMLSIALLGLCAGTASGQTYPNKPIRIVAGSAGGGGDFVARIVAQGISGPLGQPVIVDNRVSGAFAAGIVSKAPPDGYTLLVGGSVVWINPLLQTAPYDPVRDFLPVCLMVRQVNLLVAHPSVAANSVKELIALAKAKPGALNYSSSAIGSAPHLAMELFKSMAGVNIVNVPYKGLPASITGLISGEVQLTISDVGLLAPHVKSGRLIALAVTSAEPSALAPGLSTVAASGLPGYEMVGITSVFAPGKTPGAIINRLNQELVRLLTRAAVKEQLLNAGEEVVANSPEQAAAFMKSDMARWAKVIRDVGIKVN